MHFKKSQTGSQFYVTNLRKYLKLSFEFLIFSIIIILVVI